MSARQFAFHGGRIEFDDGAITYRSLGALAGGRRHRVVGRNGVGKSSLCRALGAVIPSIYRGRVKLDLSLGGRPLIPTTTDEENRLHVLPQNANEFLLGFEVDEEWSAATAGACTDPDLCRRIYDDAQLEEFRGRSGWDLSSGERQRLALALFLVRGEWLIFDEWPTHLDNRWIDRFNVLIDAVVATRGCGTLEFFTSALGSSHQELNGTVTGAVGAVQYSIDERLEALEELLATFAVRPAAFDCAAVHDGRLRTPSLRADLGRLVVPRQKTAVVLGPNGSGKTTLVKGLKINPAPSFRAKPCIILADPTLQILGPDLGAILTRGGGSNEIASRQRAAELGATVLQVPADRDPLELNFAGVKLLSVIVAVLNGNPVIAIDEPTAGLDPDSCRLATAALRVASRTQQKAILLSFPSELPEWTAEFEPQIVQMPKK